MSNFQELIGSFPKTREYVRDFFVYGFKTRSDFKEKSPRTYDNERRRLECWLSPYVRKDYVSNGANISLAIDSNLLDTNPLFRVWQTKSFTGNDIMLHFLILDLLQDGQPETAEEITDGLLTKYETFFDIQAVRRKCNAYAKEGLLLKEKKGKTVVFSLDDTLPRWLGSRENLLDAINFYQMAGPFGMIGNELSARYQHHNHSFRIKHSFFVHTLEDEILFTLLHAMRLKASVRLSIKSSRRETVSTACCIPLQIFTSTRSGRRFLCGYVCRSERFTCFRLDSIRHVTITAPLENPEAYDELLEKLDRNRNKLWGVSFQNEGNHFLESLSMTLRVSEPSENYIPERLKREGRGGVVTKTAPNTYLYKIEVFDSNELLPWIRTFTGRILSLQCSNQSVERRFYRDLQAMYRIYGIEKKEPQAESKNG